MPICEHCNARHGIFEDWAKCQEARAFQANLDRWAQDMAEIMDASAVRDEIIARLDKWVGKV